MKRILLASASIVAFAGAASAEGHTGISFTGSIDLGYNDTQEGNNGFYSEVEVVLGFVAELDNGLTAAATIDFNDLADGGGVNGADYELSLTSSDAGLFYGDTAFAAENIWVSAGDMIADNFSSADGEEVLRGEVTHSGVTAQLSYVLANNSGTRLASDTVDQLSFGASADVGNYTFIVAYQEDSGEEDPAFFNGFDEDDETTADLGSNSDFVTDEVFGISVATTFSNVNVRLAYADDSVTDSIGLEVSYPFGPVTATGYYVAENDGNDDGLGLTLAYSEGPLAITASVEDLEGGSDWSLEGSYEVGNGLTVYAGVTEEADDYYIGGEYDLGGGANLLVSFAEDDSLDSDDEIGAQEFQDGTTIELSFEF